MKLSAIVSMVAQKDYRLFRQFFPKTIDSIDRPIDSSYPQFATLDKTFLLNRKIF